MTITRPKKELLEKTGNYDAKTHQANYTLCINPQAKDLAPGSDTLELTDTMESTHFGKTGMELMLDSIKVYEYILQDGDWVKGEEVKDGVRVEKVEETASTRQYKFVLPDEKALVLEYSYKMNPGNLASDMAVKIRLRWRENCRQSGFGEKRQCIGNCKQCRSDCFQDGFCYKLSHHGKPGNLCDIPL